MNSKKIQEKHPEVYEDFFSKCDVVFSAPTGFSWSAGYAETAGGVNLSQKVPYRSYVGLIKTTDELTPDNYYEHIHYIQNEDYFKSHKFDNDINLRLYKYLRENGLDGYKIFVISEFSFFRTGITYGTITCPLAACMMYIKNPEIEVLDVDDAILKKGSYSLNNDKINRHYFNFSLKLGCLLTGTAASGLGEFVPYFNAKSLLITYRDRSIESFVNYRKQSIEYNFNFATEVTNYFIPIETIMGVEKYALPVDYMLIHIPFIRYQRVIMSPLEEYVKGIRETKEVMGKVLDDYFVEKNPVIQEMFDFSETDINKRYRNTSSFIVFEMIKDLYKIQEGEITYVSQFIEDCYRGSIVYKLLKNSPELQYVYRAILQWSYEMAKNRIRVKPISETGLFLIFSDKMTLRNYDDRLMRHLEDKGIDEPTVMYKSWEDGSEAVGLREDQNIDKNIISSFRRVYAGAKLHVHDYRANKHTLKEVEFDESNDIKNSSDIVIDVLGNKIYLKGTALTSKELRSTKKTIMLLTALLESEAHLITPKDLELGSYADRNEMQSKIITPLQKAVEKYLGRKLKLEIKGGLATNYTVKLDPGIYSISVIL